MQSDAEAICLKAGESASATENLRRAEGLSRSLCADPAKALSGGPWDSLRCDERDLWKIGSVSRGIARHDGKTFQFGVRTDVKVRQWRCSCPARPSVLHERLRGSPAGGIGQRQTLKNIGIQPSVEVGRGGKCRSKFRVDDGIHWNRPPRNGGVKLRFRPCQPCRRRYRAAHCYRTACGSLLTTGKRHHRIGGHTRRRCATRPLQPGLGGWWLDTSHTPPLIEPYCELFDLPRRQVLDRRLNFTERAHL